MVLKSMEWYNTYNENSKSEAVYDKQIRFHQYFLDYFQQYHSRQ